MPIDDQLLDILCCPETRQPVARAEATILQPLNAEIEAGRLRNRGGDKVGKPIEEGSTRRTAASSTSSTTASRSC